MGLFVYRVTTRAGLLMSVPPSPSPPPLVVFTLSHKIIWQEHANSWDCPALNLWRAPQSCQRSRAMRSEQSELSVSWRELHLWESVISRVFDPAHHRTAQPATDEFIPNVWKGKPTDSERRVACSCQVSCHSCYRRAGTQNSWHYSCSPTQPAGKPVVTTKLSLVARYLCPFSSRSGVIMRSTCLSWLEYEMRLTGWRCSLPLFNLVKYLLPVELLGILWWLVGIFHTQLLLYHTNKHPMQSYRAVSVQNCLPGTEQLHNDRATENIGHQQHV